MIDWTHRSLAAAAMIFLATGPALAQGKMRSAIHEQQSSQWQGAYLGIHAGGGWGTVAASGTATDSFDIQGFVGGGHLG